LILSIPPTDAKAANGYAELFALWKADEEPHNQSRRKSDAEFIVWRATVRLYLSEDETLLFDLTSSGSTVDEFRAEKAATLAKILWDREQLGHYSVNEWEGLCMGGSDVCGRPPAAAEVPGMPPPDGADPRTRRLAAC
jgi:hypothetical protein